MSRAAAQAASAALDAVFQVRLPTRPYPGLRPFDTDEWPIFFGRERMTDAIAGLLISKRMLMVHGDSGCGKSSLVRAGVLPRLEQDNARGGVHWRTCTALPREAPLWNLAAALAATDGATDATAPGEERIIALRRALNFGRNAPQAVAELVCDSPDRPVCILIDQFEELFDHARRSGPDEARLLTDFLVGLLEAPPPGLYAILTMRSEFLGACARFPGFAEAVNTAQYLLPRMSQGDLLRAIREPAALYGGEVSRELAERLIADAGGSQDQLPLIQHGLMLLHREHGRSDGEAWRLGVAHYRHDRGLPGLLSDHADAVLAEAEQRCLPAGHPGRVVEDLFRALTDINADGQAIRRPRSFSQLVAVTGADPEALRGVIDCFRADGVSFLKPHGSTPITPETLIDISHEALIRCWQKIADPGDGWLIREFRNGLVWRSLLVQADSFERDPHNVLAAATTDERERWLRRRNAAWAERFGGGWDRIQRLVAASIEARERSRQEAATRQRLEEEAHAREQRFRRLTWMTGGLTMLLLVIGSLATFAWNASTRANQEAREWKIQTAAAEAARATAEAARNRAETLAEEARQSAQALERIVAELDQARLASDNGSEAAYQLQQAVASAQVELTTQARNLISQPAISAPAKRPPPAAADAEPRLYIHIIDKRQAEAAHALEQRLRAQTLNGTPLALPGMEMVRAGPSRTVLRCFRAEECAGDGASLVRLLNAQLHSPTVELEDFSNRYTDKGIIRPRHYELWFAAGDIVLRR